MQIGQKVTYHSFGKTEVLCKRFGRFKYSVPTIDCPVKELRTFSIYGTGHQHESISGEYVGTFQLHGGALVYHVFEEKSGTVVYINERGLL